MKNEIIKKEEELRLAMLASDVEKLDELIDDSLVFVLPDGNLATKQMDLAAHSSKIQKISELNQSEQIINVYGNSAVVNVKADLVGTYGEVPITGAYRYARVWTKLDNKLKIVAGSITMIK